MTAVAGEPTTLTLRRTNVPAKQLPAGLWIDVLTVLRAHGLDPSPMELNAALARVVRRTPVADGGRLRPDGSVDADDMPDFGPSWWCRRCGQDMYDVVAKDRHDEWCDGLRSRETEEAPAAT